MRLTQRCGVPGCPSVQVEPYCAEHAGTITADDQSGTRPTRRPRASIASGGDGYDRRWMRLRARKLRLDPICEWPDCERDAEHVHHIDHNPISARQRWAGEPVQLPRRYRLLSF